MGTTAEKLTYLNDTKSKIKDSINSLGGNITSQTTFRNYATELDSIYSRLPKVSGTGSNISLSPTIKGRLGSVLKGNTLQDGTPTPTTPVEIQSATGLQNIKINSNNMFDASEIPSSTGIIVEEDGKTITMPLISSGNGIVSTSKKLSELCPELSVGDVVYLRATTTSSANTYIYLNTSDYLWYFGGSRTITQNDLNSIVNLYGNRYSAGETNQVVISNFRIVKNNTVSWDKYETPIIKELNLGKNLFDGDFETGGYDTGNGQKTASNDRIRCINYIKVEPNTTYTFSFENDGSAYFLEYDNSKTYLNKYTLIMYHTKLGTITTSSNTKYITFYYIPYNHTLITDEQCQLEKGSQATSYSPYFTPIYLRKSKDGTYEDYITGTPDNWSIKRQIGNRILNGSETGWARTGNIRFYCNNLFVGIKNEIGSISNYYIRGNTETTNNTFGISSAGRIYIRNDNITEVNNFKTWLSTHNTQIDYVLAEETTEPITNQEIINQLNEIYYLQSYNGTTNITITSEDLEMIMTASAIKGE